MLPPIPSGVAQLDVLGRGGGGVVVVLEGGRGGVDDGRGGGLVRLGADRRRGLS